MRARFPSPPRRRGSQPRLMSPSLCGGGRVLDTTVPPGTVSLEVVPMSESRIPSLPPLAPEASHAGFLALLPRILLHARVYFRDLKCPHQKDDARAEVIALAWK